MITINKQPLFYWHLELSNKCVLSCPRCPRTEHPGKYEIGVLDLAFVQKILTPEILMQTHKILLCGGQGDPIYCTEFVDILRYFKETKPSIEIIITTNGSGRSTKWWTEVASLLGKHDRIIFSVDGWDNESNNKYRVGSKFDSIINGIKTVTTTNPNIKITWSTIVFKFNQDKIHDIRALAKSCGAHIFQLVESSLFGSQLEKYIDPELGYDPLEPDLDKVSSYKNNHDKLFSILNPYHGETSFEAMQHYNKVKHLSMKLQNEFPETDLIPSCMNRERGLYIDAEGILYPCSWISHPFDSRGTYAGRKITWEQSIFVEHKDAFNLHKHSLEEVLTGKYWNKINESMKSKDKVFAECDHKCRSDVAKHRLKSLVKIDLP